MFGSGKSGAEVDRLRQRVAELEAELGVVRRQLRRARRDRPALTAVTERDGLDRLELRRQAALIGVPTRPRILEIGPAHQPIFAKRDGWQASTVDFMDRDGLVARYAEFAHYDPDDIEEVDYVLPPGAAMADVIDERFDIVMASHVVEHTTSLIDFVNECARLLTPSGHLALVVPDHRFTFDRLRERSSLGAVIDAASNPGGVHSLGTLIEEKLYAVRHASSTSWEPGHQGRYSLVNGCAEVEAAKAASRTGAYVDAHHWVFTPHHLRLLLCDLADLEFIELRESHFADTVRHEFFVNLSPAGPGPDMTRAELLTASDDERRGLDHVGWRPAGRGAGASEPQPAKPAE